MSELTLLFWLIVGPIVAYVVFMLVVTLCSKEKP